MKKQSGLSSEETNDNGTRGNFNNRFRGNNTRRNRSRPPNDSRGLNTRIFNNTTRDRRVPNSTREGSNISTTNPEMQSLDIYDCAQWPSIQESSSNIVTRGRHSIATPVITSQLSSNEVDNTIYEERRDYASDNRNNNDGSYDNVNRGMSNYRRPNGAYRMNSYNQAQPNYQHSYNQGFSQRGYVDRSQQSSQTNGRVGRGTRYQNYGQASSRGYNQHGFQFKKFSRGYNSQFQNFYAHDPTYMQPTLYDPRYSIPGIMETAPPIETPKPKLDLDPLKQVEYYFSDENLTNDIYIRKIMDCDGWVSLNAISGFHRIQSKGLTFEEFIACLSTTEIIELDLQANRVRCKNNPTKWPMEEGTDLTPAVPSTTTNVYTSPLNTSPGQVIPSTSYNLSSTTPDPAYMNQYSYAQRFPVLPQSGGYSMHHVMHPNNGYGMSNNRVRNMQPFPFYPGNFPNQYVELYPDYSQSYCPMEYGYNGYIDPGMFGFHPHPFSNTIGRPNQFGLDVELGDGYSPEIVNGSVDNNSSVVETGSEPKSSNVEDLVHEMAKVDLGHSPVCSS